jgi:multiple antibiotic resistance protein
MGQNQLLAGGIIECWHLLPKRYAEGCLDGRESLQTSGGNCPAKVVRMLETGLKSFTTFFATIGPVEAAVLFATLTPKMRPAERQAIAVRATLIASAILGFFTLLGGPILNQLGVSIAALQAAGGVVLLLIAIDMIFARPGGAIKLTAPEGAEAHSREDVAVFPLATPLLAGPGAMSAGILLAANAHGEPLGLAVVTASLVAVMLLTLFFLLIANQLNHVLGVTAQRVLMRVFGILLAAIAVQAFFNGISASGLIPVAPKIAG